MIENEAIKEQAQKDIANDINSRLKFVSEALYYSKTSTTNLLTHLNFQDNISSIQIFQNKLKTIYQSFNVVGTEVTGVQLLIAENINGTVSPLYLVHEEELTENQQTTIESQLPVNIVRISDHVVRLNG